MIEALKGRAVFQTKPMAETDVLGSRNAEGGGLVREVLLVAMPGAPSSFLFLVAMPGAPSSSP